MADDETLYHYTNALGLRGISGGRPDGSGESNLTFWASNNKIMNDTTEGSHVRDLIAARVAPHIAAGNERAIAFMDLLWGKNRNYMIAAELYVVSLSSAPDLLSQWRGYTSYGDAYMLHLNAEGIKRPVGGMGGLSQCQYVKSLDDLNTDVFDDILRGEPKEYYRLQKYYGIVEGDPYNAGPSGSSPGDYYPEENHMGQTVPVARRLMATGKHPSFIEEREWRIIAEVPPFDDSVQVRASARGLVDYVELSYPREALVGITVGPGPRQSEAARTASLLFPHLPEAAIVLSDTPFTTD